MSLLSFLYILRGSKGIIALVLLASILSGLASIALIALINNTLSQNAPATERLVWSFAGLCLLLPLTRVISQTLLAYLSEKAVYALRMSLSQRMLATPLRQLEEIGSPTLLATLTGDIASITAAFSNLPFFCMQLAIVIGSLAYLAWLAWLPFLMFVGILVFAVLTIQLSEYPARRFLSLGREETDALYEHFRALTDGAKELKLHSGRRETFLYDVLMQTAESLRKHNVKGAGIYAASRGWAQLLFFIVLGAVIFALPALVSMDRASVTGYALTILYMSFPLDHLMGMFPVMSYANICIRKVESLKLSLAGDAPKTAAAARDARRDDAAVQDWESLELSAVSHSYRSEKDNSSFLLGPIDLTMRPGELIFITGGNGSGKTTLAKLLTGLYLPESGEIRLDGKPITDANRDWYRQHFSALFSDFFLFERLLGLENPELDQQASRYLHQLQLEHKVQVTDGTLSTIDLSQGQRKRLALLTAYLEDRPIYLFDEWAADQDPHFKEVFYYQLLPELKTLGKTVIVISHDDRYYHVADRVIKLDYGRLVEDAWTVRHHEPLAEEVVQPTLPA